jgi:hypothetical protein
MRYRIAMLAIAMAAFLGAGLTAAPGPAQAATTVGTFNFFLHETGEDNNCIVTNGVGNQLTVAYAGAQSCANITITKLDKTEGSDPVYEFTDGSGNCLRANNSDVVKVESGTCSSSDTGEWWIATYGTVGSGNTVRFENVLQALWLKTNADIAGYDVWVGTGGSNNWDLI